MPPSSKGFDEEAPDLLSTTVNSEMPELVEKKFPVLKDYEDTSLRRISTGREKRSWT